MSARRFGVFVQYQVWATTAQCTLNSICRSTLLSSVRAINRYKFNSELISGRRERLTTLWSETIDSGYDASGATTDRDGDDRIRRQTTVRN